MAADDGFQHVDPLIVVTAGEPACGGLSGRQAVDGIVVVFEFGDARVFAGELDGLADKNDALEPRALPEQVAVGAFIMCLGAVVVGVHLTCEVAVGVDIQTVARRAPDEVVEAQIAGRRLVHVLDKDQNRVHTAAGDGGEMLVWELIHAIAGVNHPR